jgi:hypothetical protein
MDSLSLPSAASSTIRHRCASFCGALPVFANALNSSTCSLFKLTGTAFLMPLPTLGS